MMDMFMVPEVVVDHIGIIAIAGLFLGLDKGGLKPLSVLAMYFILKVFDPAMMLSVFAPLLLVGEFFPAYHYRGDAKRSIANRILPWMLVGLVVGTLIGTRIDQKLFRLLIGIFVLGMGIINLVLERKAISIDPILPITGTMGILAGIGSVIGNAAGGITNVYFLSQTKGKRALIGSSSYLYIVVNSCKVVLYLFVWRIFSLDTLAITVTLIPFLLVGLLLATAIIKVMPEPVFKVIFYFSIFYAGLSLLLGSL